MKRKTMCLISTILLFTLLSNCLAIPVSSQENVVEGQSTVQNGGFETPDLKALDERKIGWKAINYNDYDLSWRTTATDGKIEYGWLNEATTPDKQSPHMKPTVTQEIVGKGPLDGFQFAEVVPSQVSSLYQSISLHSGESYQWTVHHRGRAGVDTLAFILTDDPHLDSYVKTSISGTDHFQKILNWMKGTGITAPQAGNMDEYKVYTTKLKGSATFENSSDGSYFSFSQDSDHTEKFSIYLISTAKEDWGEYQGNYYSNANKDILYVLTPFSTSFTNSSGQISPSGGNLLDSMSFADKKGTNLLINAGFDDVEVKSSYGNVIAANSPTNPREGIGWCTTATDYSVEVGNIKYGDAYKLGASVQTVTKNLPSVREGQQFVELNANQESSLYQTLATNPGKMYRWSLSHRGRSGLETMALIIGPQQSYEPKKTSSSSRDQLMQMVDWLYQQTDVVLDIPAQGCSNEIKLYTSKFNASGGFEYANSISWQNDETHTEEWSIWIISSLNDDWHDYGDIENGAVYNYNYIVPMGQDKTVFGFVSINAVDATGKADKTYGNLLDNVSFKEFYYINAEFDKFPISEYGTVYIKPENADNFEPDGKDMSQDTGWLLAGSNISIHYQPGDRDFIGGYINGVFVPADEWLLDTESGEYYYLFENVNSSITVDIIYQARNVIYDSCNQYEYQYNGDGTGHEVPLDAENSSYISHEPQADDGWKFMGWEYILTHESEIRSYLFDAVHKVEYYQENGNDFLKISKILSDDTTQTVVDQIPEGEGITFFAKWKYRQRVVSKTFNEDLSTYENSVEGGTVELKILYTDDESPESPTAYIPSGGGSAVGQELHSASGDTYIGVSAANKTGFIFTGWYDKDGALITRNPSYSYKVKDGDVTELYAYFEPMGYEVVVNTNVMGEPEDLSKYFAIDCSFSNLRENHIYAISGLAGNNTITVNGEIVVNPTNIKSDEFGEARVTLYMKNSNSATFLHLPAGTVCSVVAGNSTRSEFSVRGEVSDETLSQQKNVDLFFYKVGQFVSFAFGKNYEGILSRQSPQEITITSKSSYTLDVETKYSPSIYTGLNISLCFYRTDGTAKPFFTGTRILMIDMSDSENPSYYSYTVNSQISAINLTEFTVLGSTSEHFTPSTGEMFTEKLVFIVDYVGTQDANTGKIALVYSDDGHELNGMLSPIKKTVTIGADTTQLTAVAAGNGNTACDGPFTVSITVTESSPAVNTTYEGYQNSKYAVKLSLASGDLPDGSYALVDGNKYYCNNGYINISPLEQGTCNVRIYSPVPLELVGNKIAFKATLLSVVSTSVSIPIEKSVTPIEFNCVEVAIDAEVVDKVLHPGNVTSINVQLKHKGIDEVKLSISKKNNNGTYSEILADVNVELPADDNRFPVPVGSGFTAVSGETYIFSFVGYSGGVPICRDQCCVVGGYQ